MQTEKVAIIKNGIDIGRIIPFNMDQDEREYDFKISFAKNNYEISAYSLLSKIPERVAFEDMVDWEISYHRSNEIKPTVIHLKEKKNQPVYKQLPLQRLVDPTIHSEFPIPFMRIEIPSDFTGKNYKPKPKEHIIFDLENNNVAEFYLTHIDFNYEMFAEKWPTISLRLMTSSFEFFATNNLLTDNIKFKYFMPSGGEIRAAAEEFVVNNDMKFYVNIYNNPEYLEDKIKVTFIENEFADALLGLSQVGFENECGKIEMLPAFQEDLSRDTMSREEKSKWEYRFKRKQEKLEREIRKIREGRAFNKKLILK
jgi:hypothetical protein